jgi:hypothetical protein
MTSSVIVTSPESSVDETAASDEEAEAVGVAESDADTVTAAVGAAESDADTVTAAVGAAESDSDTVTEAESVGTALVETGASVAIVIAASVPLKYRTISTSVPFGYVMFWIMTVWLKNLV